MEILAIQTPPRQPIGAKDNIRICPKCHAILKFGYEDIWVKHTENSESDFITCMSCKNDIQIGVPKYKDMNISD